VNRGAQLLSEYLADRRIPRTEFADTIERNRALITMWCKGTHRPGVENRRRIRHATHGLVPMRSWDEPLVARGASSPAREPAHPNR
jgi:hypothetical protein